MRKKLRTISIVVGSLVVVFTITGFFILPPVLTSVVSKNLGQALHRQVTIQKIRINPYTLVVEVQGMSIKDQDRPEAFVSLDRSWSTLNGHPYSRGLPSSGR